MPVLATHSAPRTLAHSSSPHCLFCLLWLDATKYCQCSASPLDPFFAALWQILAKPMSVAELTPLIPKEWRAAPAMVRGRWTPNGHQGPKKRTVLKDVHIVFKTHISMYTYLFVYVYLYYYIYIEISTFGAGWLFGRGNSFLGPCPTIHEVLEASSSCSVAYVPLP